jgi:hypothetical protein
VTEVRKQRLAENQMLFREINERIEATAEAQGTDPHAYEFVCECSSLECFERLELTLHEYGRIRKRPQRFLVLSGHERPEIEDVVERRGRAAIVEKRGEAAAADAVA